MANHHLNVFLFSLVQCFLCFQQNYFFAKSSLIFAFRSSPNKSIATIFPSESNKKVVGICVIPYWIAIGSFISFKLDT